MSQASLCVFTSCTLSRSFQSVTAKNRKEVLVVRTSYHKEDLAVSRTQAQATRNQPKEELLAAQKEVLVRALFLGCTVTLHLSRSSILQLDGGLGYGGAQFEFSRSFGMITSK